jgi:hypothetical protein
MKSPPKKLLEKGAVGTRRRGVYQAVQRGKRVSQKQRIVSQKIMRGWRSECRHGGSFVRASGNEN